MKMKIDRKGVVLASIFIKLPLLPEQNTSRKLSRLNACVVGMGPIRILLRPKYF